MPFTLPKGFQIAGSDIIDDRFITTESADRFTYKAAGVMYHGLTVYASESREYFILGNTASYDDNAGWSKIYTSDLGGNNLSVQGNITASNNLEVSPDGFGTITLGNNDVIISNTANQGTITANDSITAPFISASTHLSASEIANTNLIKANGNLTIDAENIALQVDAEDSTIFRHGGIASLTMNEDRATFKPFYSVVAGTILGPEISSEHHLTLSASSEIRAKTNDFVITSPSFINPTIHLQSAGTTIAGNDTFGTIEFSNLDSKVSESAAIKAVASTGHAVSPYAGTKLVFSTADDDLNADKHNLLTLQPEGNILSSSKGNNLITSQLNVLRSDEVVINHLTTGPSPEINLQHRDASIIGSQYLGIIGFSTINSAVSKSAEIRAVAINPHQQGVDSSTRLELYTTPKNSTTSELSLQLDPDRNLYRSNAHDFDSSITTSGDISASGTFFVDAISSSEIYVNKIIFDNDPDNTFIQANSNATEDLEIHADYDILLKADHDTVISSSVHIKGDIKGGGTDVGDFTYIDINTGLLTNIITIGHTSKTLEFISDNEFTFEGPGIILEASSAPDLFLKNLSATVNEGNTIGQLKFLPTVTQQGTATAAINNIATENLGSGNKGSKFVFVADKKAEEGANLPIFELDPDVGSTVLSASRVEHSGSSTLELRNLDNNVSLGDELSQINFTSNDSGIPISESIASIALQSIRSFDADGHELAPTQFIYESKITDTTLTSVFTPYKQKFLFASADRGLSIISPMSIERSNSITVNKDIMFTVKAARGNVTSSISTLLPQNATVEDLGVWGIRSDFNTEPTHSTIEHDQNWIRIGEKGPVVMSGRDFQSETEYDAYDNYAARPNLTISGGFKQNYARREDYGQSGGPTFYGGNPTFVVQQDVGNTGNTDKGWGQVAQKIILRAARTDGFEWYEPQFPDASTSGGPNVDTMTAWYLRFDYTFKNPRDTFSQQVLDGNSSPNEMTTAPLAGFALKGNDNSSDFLPEGVVYHEVSDKRLKTNIIDTECGLSDLLKIKVRDYSWWRDKNNEPPKKANQTGFIAQELYEAYPKAVSRGGEDPLENPWSITPDRLIPLLIKSVQEQQKTIENLQKEIDNLKSKML